MCGIFGVIAKPGASVKPAELKRLFINLALLSESRGRESFGIAVKDYYRREIKVTKGALPVSRAFRNKNVAGGLNLVFAGKSLLKYPLAVMGHSRLATNGSRADQNNNQPVIKDDIVALHNGIIVNAESMWCGLNDIKRCYAIDTEIIPSFIRSKINSGAVHSAAVEEFFSTMKGTASIALIFNEIEPLYIGTNNGSLYIYTNSKDILVFASERAILENALIKSGSGLRENISLIRQINSGGGLWVNPVDEAEFYTDGYFTSGKSDDFTIAPAAIIEDAAPENTLVDINSISVGSSSTRERALLEYNSDAIGKLKRCTKCILPETFPYIEFDEKGVCNYCRNYKKKEWTADTDEFMKIIDRYRGGKLSPDCIIPFSGGRDSSFLLHYAKKELKLNPVAFTYDWGMVTDLARRNIARVCGKLGVENIIVSADLRWKRDNIKKNIAAWLKKPELGMIPLFMAGDKYFFFYTNRLKKQTGIKLNIWGVNPLENTDFKVGFAGIPPRFNKKRIYSLDYFSQIKLLSFIGFNYLRNPSYLNQSVIDTFGSYLVRYFYPQKDYYHFYDYFKWDERIIEDVLMNEYEWEKAIDTDSTWRIGDGTAGFYNYVYCTVAGFSENDTFRSNQIREGMITRDYALAKCAEENSPRYENIKWYLEIVGLDFDTVIKRINSISKLY